MEQDTPKPTLTKAGKKRKKLGRPTKYTPLTVAKFLTYIASGMSAKKACEQEDMPALQNIFIWLGKYPDFRDKYARAKEDGAEAISEETFEIADSVENRIVGDDRSDNARVSAVKLRVDTRRWFLSKFKPKKYGDKLDLTSDNKVLPAPLLNVIRHNDSDKKDLPTPEAN